jgi:hypothetical protein
LCHFVRENFGSSGSLRELLGSRLLSFIFSMRFNVKSIPLVAVALGLSLAPAGWSQQSDNGPSVDHRATVGKASTSLVSRFWQNEIRDLPADHSALFAASREVTVGLELPSTGDLSTLGNALVTVIRPNGEITQLQPSSDGLVTLGQVEEGPHAFVVTSDRAHGAKLIYVDEATEQQVQSVAMPRMTLADVNGEQLRPFIDEIGDVNGPLSDLIPSVAVGPEFGSRIVLAEDGTVRGKVLPLADKSGGARLKGTRVAIFFRGIQVAETTCDEAGEFVVRGMQPGVHGVVVAGNEGYAVFALDVVASDADVTMQADALQYVSRTQPPVQAIPVVLIPPPLIPGLVSAIEGFYGFNQPMSVAGEPVGMPVGGGFTSPGLSGSGGGGGGVGGGGGGLGGFGGIAAVAALAAVASDSSDNQILLPPVASPVLP